MDGDHDDGDGEYEEVELIDDQPMHIVDSIYIGSIDAAMNSVALKAKDINQMVALLTANEIRKFDQCDLTVVQHIDVEDSIHESLFERLPEMLEVLNMAMYDRQWTTKQANTSQTPLCTAGRSRSPSLIAAWMVARCRYTLIKALNHITMIRPWIDINNHFLTDLNTFEQVIRYDRNSNRESVAIASLLASKELPRLDFGPALVKDIQHHQKTITMRLPPEVEHDRYSDLSSIFPFSTIVATTKISEVMVPFAYLRVDHVERQCLAHLSDSTVAKQSGLKSKCEVLELLRQFYPDVTMDTPL